MASSSEADMMDNTAEGEVDDDLFGSEDQSDGPAEKVRELSDRELDSGDDEDREDRVPPKAEAEEVDYGGRDARILDSTVWRHPLPKPADGEVRSDIPIPSIKSDIFLVQHIAPTQVSGHRSPSLRPYHLRSPYSRSSFRYQICELLRKRDCCFNHTISHEPFKQAREQYGHLQME
jgi:RNA polymerase-associated protein LEO1